MSQPTVGRNVKRLQDVLGTQLLVPSATGIALTEEGEFLAKSLIEVDEKLVSISSGVRREKSGIEGTVRVSVTEGLAGLFVVPKMKKFSAEYSRIRVFIQNPINLNVFKDNQCDIMIGFAEDTSSEICSSPLGFLHFVPLVSQDYIRRHGLPTKDNLESHYFVDTDIYRGGQKIFTAWQDAIRRGTLLHMSENSFAYALMVRSGLGIGLLGSFGLSDPTAVLLDIDVNVTLPMYCCVYKDRLNSKPVKIVFDWLRDIFGPHNALFSANFDVDRIPRDDISWVISSLVDWPQYRG
jgi:DNA-binding transcriptional LysR family regulator